MRRKGGNVILCDSCSAPIERLADAVLQWRYDARSDAIAEVQLAHNSTAGSHCTFRERHLADEFEEHAAAAFAGPHSPAADRLRSLARLWEGVTRLLGKVQRLAAREPKAGLAEMAPARAGAESTR